MPHIVAGKLFHIFFGVQQYGPFSERSEVTTGPGAPEACRSPHVTCKSPTCAVISWEVRISHDAKYSFSIKQVFSSFERTCQVTFIYIAF